MDDLNQWNLKPPASSEIHDTAVEIRSQHLLGQNIALLVSGSVAALKTPLLARELRRHGATVHAIASTEALKYTTLAALEWSTNNKVITTLSATSEHLNDSRPFDVFLVAPATYNTINKMAHGIADNAITTTLASAIGRMQKNQTQIMLVPAMHGSLHNSILSQSLHVLKNLGVHFVKPKAGFGKHNFPELDFIVGQVCRTISKSSLKGLSVLVTSGTTPVYIDSIRHITTHFTGELGIRIAETLFLKGADVFLIQGKGKYLSRPDLPKMLIHSFNQYQQSVSATLAKKSFKLGIFTAAVADYQPESIQNGKIPSGQQQLNLSLVPTTKIIDEVKIQCPDLKMITFKFQQNISHQTLMEIATKRLNPSTLAVIANRGEEKTEQGEHIAYLVQANKEPLKITGKQNIADTIIDFLEQP